MATPKLSKASEYEQLFKTRHRGSGRPPKETDEVLFPSKDRNPLLARIAQRRAYAVVHEENRARLTEVFLKELKVLERRPIEEVASDVGINLTGSDNLEDNNLEDVA